jgi:hypothetical protein
LLAGILSVGLVGIQVEQREIDEVRVGKAYSGLQTLLAFEGGTVLAPKGASLIEDWSFKTEELSHQLSLVQFGSSQYTVGTYTFKKGLSSRQQEGYLSAWEASPLQPGFSKDKSARLLSHREKEIYTGKPFHKGKEVQFCHRLSSGTTLCSRQRIMVNPYPLVVVALKTTSFQALDTPEVNHFFRGVQVHIDYPVAKAQKKSNQKP